MNYSSLFCTGTIRVVISIIILLLSVQLPCYFINISICVSLWCTERNIQNFEQHRRSFSTWWGSEPGNGANWLWYSQHLVDLSQFILSKVRSSLHLKCNICYLWKCPITKFYKTFSQRHVRLCFRCWHLATSFKFLNSAHLFRQYFQWTLPCFGSLSVVFVSRVFPLSRFSFTLTSFCSFSLLMFKYLFMILLSAN